jgi:hypothetical protein
MFFNERESRLPGVRHFVLHTYIERTRFLSALSVFLLAVFLIAACDNGGGMDNGDDNSPPNASVTASTTDPVVGDTVALDASKSDDPDGDELSFSWTLETPGGSDATLSSPTAARPWYVPDTSGDYRAEVAVSDSKLSDTDDVSMEALEKLPETVTVPFENIADDGDSLVAQAITWRGSVVTETKRSGTAIISASRESGAFCAQEGDLFAEDCISLTPTGDYNETQTLRVDRKEVSVSVGLDLPYGNVGETDVTIFEPFGADSTTFTGENTLTLPKRSASMDRRLVADLITEEPDRSDHVDRLVAETAVSANTSAERTLQPSLVPACNDSISNDVDELVDVWEDTDGDGVPSPKDVGDYGCVSKTDDNEGHWVITRETQSLNRTYTVSNKKGERSEVLIDASSVSPFDESVRDAIGDGIEVTKEAQMETNQSGEGWALRFNTGPENELGNVNTTEVVTDQDTTDGWNRFRFTFPPDWFATGLYYKILGVHGSKIRDEPAGDGGGEVVFLRADGDPRLTYFLYVVEEENFDGFENSRKHTTGKNTQTTCTTQKAVEVCTTARKDGFP